VSVRALFARGYRLGARGPQVHILSIFSSLRPLAGSFISPSLSYHCRTITRAEGVNTRIGHFLLGGTVRGLGTPKCTFCLFSPFSWPIARSFIERSLPVRHRTLPLAECVNDRTRDFSQGHNVWGLGPPKSTFCRFLAVFGL